MFLDDITRIQVNAELTEINLTGLIFFDKINKQYLNGCLTMNLFIYLLAFLWLGLSAQLSAADTTVPHIFRVKGGQIIDLSAAINCDADCPAARHSNFLAFPDKDYRFAGWTGSCANNIGTLCTLNTQQQARVSARFIKTQAAEVGKAILLLHDTNNRPTVWNEFVKQLFANRCPIIYGGVILGADSAHPANQVYCYRLAFGYFAQIKAANALFKANPSQTPTAQYEILAALSSLIARHPNLSLSLIAQEDSASAVFALLPTVKSYPFNINSLLFLQSPSPDHDLLVSDSESIIDSNIDSMVIDAKPRHSAKISAALSELSKTWWTSP